MNATPVLHRLALARSIRVAASPADRESVARLRYAVYVEEMGRAQAHAESARGTIHEPLDDTGLVLAAFDAEGRAVATVRLNAALDERVPFRELYGWEAHDRARLARSVLGSKLVVDAAHRGSVLSLEIMRRATREALARGFRYCFLDANAHLVPLYARVGFVARAQRTHPLFGSVTVMEWDMHDVEHLRAIRSPLRRDVAACLDGASCAA